MAEKILNVRIALKYDTYANWTTNNPILKAGEVAIATIPTGDNNNVSTSLPAVLMKVGDGTSNYNALPFLSAKAADVHAYLSLGLSRLLVLKVRMMLKAPPLRLLKMQKHIQTLLQTVQ